MGAATAGARSRRGAVAPGAGGGEAGDAQDFGERTGGCQRLWPGDDRPGRRAALITGDPGELAMFFGGRQRAAVVRHRAGHPWCRACGGGDSASDRRRTPVGECAPAAIRRLTRAPTSRRRPRATSAQAGRPGPGVDLGREIGGHVGADRRSRPPVPWAGVLRPERCRRAGANSRTIASPSPALRRWPGRRRAG